MQKNKLAFTLMELLITITLFTLLLATALYSFRFMSLNVRKINNTNPEIVMNYTILRDAFSSMYHYIDVNPLSKIGKDRYFFYFKGTSNGCKFITQSGYFYNELVLVNLIFKDEQLWYAESKIFSKNINYKEINNIKFYKKKRVLKNVHDLSFSYTIDEKKSLELFNKLPTSVSLTFKNQKNQQKKYIFAIKSKTKIRKQIIIRDYDLSKTQMEEFN